MKKLIFFLGVLFFVSPTIYSQTKISGTEEERLELEQLIKEKIDSVRIKKNRKALSIDEILYKAAMHHSEYIKKTGKLSHTETGKKEFKSPQDRADFYGAQQLLVGENILWSDYNLNITSDRGKKFNARSIESLANALVTIWLESPGHYKNLLLNEYTLTGVAVVFNTTENRVYVTQVFAYPAP